jgi:glycosyltransferase involved in cell wall biosynthesis
VRLAVYSDYSYRVVGGRLSAQLPFSLFVQGLAPHCERLVVTGRLDPSQKPYPYSLNGVKFVPLPHYDSGANLGQVLRSIPAGIKRFWRMLDDVDVVWILGPNPPQVLVFSLLAIARRRRLVLGVRQHLPELIRHRHPDKPAVKLAAVILEAAFRLLARRIPVVVVGPDLARRYCRAPTLHVSYVSLLEERDILAADDDDRAYDGPELRLLSVGRLDPEKNPLLLADVFARALQRDPRWRLDVCGGGPLRSALQDRLVELGVADRATLRGYVPISDGLLELYRHSHALLHVSFTEGVPQVLLEAFASRLPVVATAVGGVAAIVEGRGWLVPPCDADAASAAVHELAASPELRAERVERASEEVRHHTLEQECSRLAAFLATPDPTARGARRRGGRGLPSRP